MTLTEGERKGCRFANRKLALAITPYFFNLIDREDKDCPIRKQIIPRGDEMTVAPWESPDPLAEDSHLVVPGPGAPLPRQGALPRHRPLRSLLSLLHPQPHGQQ